MHDSARSLTFADTSNHARAEQAVADARRVFQRTLAAWVCDLLELRRRGLDQPGWVRIQDESLRREAA